MTTKHRKVWAAGLGLALVAGAGGIAAAAEPLSWYSGGNASLADPDSITTLKIVNAGGTEITSGSLDDPLGAFAVAADTVRSDDTSASLFVHLASLSSAPGGWSGLQASATTKYTGSGATPPPSGAAGKPFVSLAGSLPLTQVAETFPNEESAPTYAGVYELRLRTSSATGGVSNRYASAFVKVSGSQWAVTTAPDLGEDSADPTAITAGWGAGFAYGGTRNVTVKVVAGSTAAKGSVVLRSGSVTVSQAPKTLDANGAAILTIPKGKLLPGKRAVTVAFTTSDATVAASAVSAPHSYTVARGNVAAPTFKVTKKITAKKAGSLTVTVAKPVGLLAPTGKVDVTLKKGSKTVTIKNKTVNSKGQVKVAVRKQKAGKWKVTITYKGDARYNARKSVAKKVTVARK